MPASPTSKRPSECPFLDCSSRPDGLRLTGSLVWCSRDREHFLDDLEEDPELWKQVNLYQDEDASSTLSDSEVEDFPGPKMNDLIRGMEEMQVDDMETDD